MSIEGLITITPPDEVEEDFKKEAAAWETWDSSTGPATFPFSYSEDEEVLILTGKATLTPKGKGVDATPIVIGAGEKVIFHKGFKCDWVVDEPMTKHYRYPTPPPKIACDSCGKECYEASFFVEATEQDICPDCKKTRDPEKRRLWRNAEPQVHGEPIDDGSAPKRSRKAPEKKKVAKKKTAAKKKAPKK